MQSTTEAAVADGKPGASRRRRVAVAVGVGVLAAAGLGVGLAVSLGGSGTAPEGAAETPYGYYQSVMGRYGSGSMMGGGPGSWMEGRSGYEWMTGGAGAPGWMRGGTLPGFMMDGGTDPGAVMGRLFADAPGPTISPTAATRLGDAVPPGATADRGARRLTFTSSPVRLVVVASPSMPSENFRVAGMTDPTVVVPAGARVSIELVNADGDMAHGLVVTAPGASSSRMPMMTAAPAFDGAALWFLGESTSAGMHTGTVRFTAGTAGTYEYLCPVPGHAREGMAGTLVVSTRR